MSDYLTYMLVKVAVITVAAFFWGIYCGRTGRDLSGRKEQQGPSGTTTREKR